MELKNIDNGIIDKLSARAARDEAPTPTRTPDQASDRTETPRPVAPKRPPQLITTVNRSLTESGIAAAPAADAAPDLIGGAPAEAEKAQAGIQDEKSAQALQAFVHSLVEAANADRTAPAVGSTVTPSVAQPAGLAQPGLPTTSAASAYEGLASRLEGLVLEIDSDPTASRGNETLARLDSAFRNLVNASAGSANQPGSAPDLQTVLKNIARNLQSTGDPTLASTGNLINTAA
jgi:hypothetical protein